MLLKKKIKISSASVLMATVFVQNAHNLLSAPRSGSDSRSADPEPDNVVSVKYIPLHLHSFANQKLYSNCFTPIIWHYKWKEKDRKKNMQTVQNENEYM
jgi:hypothetical protein